MPLDAALAGWRSLLRREWLPTLAILPLGACVPWGTARLSGMELSEGGSLAQAATVGRGARLLGDRLVRVAV